MSSTNTTDESAPLRHQRLLKDIQELTKKPYPNIKLHVHDEDLTQLCLVLSPKQYRPMHLTVSFKKSYPNRAPTIRMDSTVYHPNVFGSFICADILKDGDGYTPAYTLKGIAIQMLSFFSSESVEQDYGGEKIPLREYRRMNKGTFDAFHCTKCNFGKALQSAQVTSSQPFDQIVPGLYRQRDSPARPRRRRRPAHRPARQHKFRPQAEGGVCFIDNLPNEMLLLILDKIEEFEDLTSFARAWPRVSNLITEFGVVRRRELQCFCTKQSFQVAKLGIGVTADRGQLASEFDLLSEDAYLKLGIRRSIHGISFSSWLPLPLSWRHWRIVRGGAREPLENLKSQIKVPDPSIADVMYTFMNDIVVRLNQVATDWRHEDERSTLRHASEKAIESYFHLFHLLVCLAMEDLTIVQSANRLLMNFISGKRSKEDCPNLGHLLVALLISDVEVTDGLRKAIITEAITRNVVWLLDRRGAGMPELSFMETDTVSQYRLQKTFEGSRTSYRLLMFSELFRRIARPSSGASGGKRSLAQVHEELFDRTGAPPPGAAERLASEVRRLHTVNDFPSFLVEMGMRSMPSAESFSEMLRQTVRDSMNKGYSRWAVPQTIALAMRMLVEPKVGAKSQTREWVRDRPGFVPDLRGISFFPGRPQQAARGRGGRGGRGRGRGSRGS